MEKHNRLLYLAKNKLDCVEMLVSKSVQDGIIGHNEFLAIIPGGPKKRVPN